MGLGKTIQGIGLINTLNPFPKVLIMCPSVSKYSWLSEIEAWRTYLYTAVVIEAQSGIDFDSAEVFIINYDILDRYKKELMSVTWDLVIADEFHYLSNVKSQRSQVAYSLNTRRRLYLSGTPVPNKIKNLWAPLRSLSPAWGSYREFTTRYCGGHFDGWGRHKQWKAEGATNLEELHERLKPFMIRRLSDKVLNLPPLTTEIIPIDPDRESRDLADQIAKVAKELLQLKVSGNVKCMKALDEMNAKKIAEYRKHAGDIKLPHAIKLIQEVINKEGKVVVFAYHRHITQAIHKHFKDCSVMVIGGVPSIQKKAAADAFQNDPKVKVFVGNIESAGVTLTLTAARTEIFVEHDWMPVKVLQAMKRCHRIGQTRPVGVKLLVLNDSIDVNMARSIDKKIKHMKVALDGINPNWAELLFEKEEHE